MKHNVIDMEEQMAMLDQKMPKIAALNDTIDTTLQPSRQKIEQLSGIQRLMKKLEFVFELPAMMTKCLEMEAYSEAVGYWQKTSTILSTYSHLPSFEKIAKDTQAIVNTLKSRLHEKVSSKRSSGDTVAEAVELLLVLGEDPVGLRTDYLDSRVSVIQGKLEESEESLASKLSSMEGGDNDNHNDNDNGTKTSLKQFISLLMSNVFDDFSDCYRSYVHLFVSSATSNELKEQANSQFDDFSRVFLHKFYQLIKEAIEGLASGSPVNLIQGLELLFQRCVSQAKVFPHEWRMMDEINDMIQSSVHHDIKSAFGTSLTLFKKRIASMVQQSNQEDKADHEDMDLLQVSKDTTEVVINDVFETLKSLEPFVSSEAEYFGSVQSVATDLVYIQLQQVFLNMNEHLLFASKNTSNLGDGDGNGNEDGDEDTRGSGGDNPAMVLVLCAVSLSFETYGVAKVVSVLEGLFPSSRESMVMVNAADIIKRFKETAKNILSFYVQMQGQKVSQMIGKSMDTTNWLKSKEPRDVRRVFDFVLTDVFAVHKHVQQIFDNIERAESTESNSSSRKSHDSSRRSMDVGGFGGSGTR
eukprot:TRINITY_DN569_c0_g2_i2.p1 TRINITY_DN569_c0_g2~~TRINITY_DN569_c0_g2_i2.p1  ORF type:complete len:582 (+),score=182.07 TRINITY_DN569_c0_g2_i2:808-2553(+)